MPPYDVQKIESIKKALEPENNETGIRSGYEFFESGEFNHDIFKMMMSNIIKKKGIPELLRFFQTTSSVCSRPAAQAYIQGIERALHNDLDTALSFFYRSIALEPSSEVHVAIMSVLDQKLAVDSSHSVDLESIFTNIYKTRMWGEHEGTVSGFGSTLEVTQKIQNELIDFISANSIKSIVDVPCGDFYWMNKMMSHPNMSGISYIGADIVDDMIKENIKIHARDGVSFLHADITSSPLPSADMIICRELFIHLTNHQITQAITNLSKVEATYFAMSSSFINLTNVDNATGGVRIVNLMLPPFSLPQPATVIWEDGSAQTTFGKTRYGLGVWRRSDLEAFARTQGTSASIGRPA